MGESKNVDVIVTITLSFYNPVKFTLLVIKN